jgi:predicted amidohydrolase YtcJ
VVWRDSAGEPTGVVSELDSAMPLPEPTGEELKQEIADGVRELFTRYGTTSIGEISETVEGVRVMDEAISDGEIMARVSVFLWAPGTMTIDQACDWERELPLKSPREKMQIRGLKVFADGGYSARNAAARTAYRAAYASRKGSRGKVNLNRRQIAAAMRRANEAGLQLAVHANGERAQDVACAGVELAGTTTDPRLRTRIEHAGNLVTDEVTVENWRRAGILPVPQPVFLYNFGDFFPLFLGPAGARGRFPFRTLLDDGWRIPGSSDVWIGSEDGQTNPLFSIWCCLRRQTFFGEIVDPEQAISIEEALQMHTINAAHTLGEADRRGSLKSGKLADIVVLERDPREAAVDEIPEIAVEAVICNGRLAYSGSEARVQ